MFLVEFLRGNETLADSIDHLLVAGFYLLNLGYAMLAMSYGKKPETIDGVLEALSFKVGLVMLVLGATHFFNMSMIAQLGKKLDRFFQSRRGDAPAQAAPAKSARRLPIPCSRAGEGEAEAEGCGRSPSGEGAADTPHSTSASPRPPSPARGEG